MRKLFNFRIPFIMLKKITHQKLKDGKGVYGAIYQDDADNNVHYLTKEEILAVKNGKEMLHEYNKKRNEKKKIRNIDQIYGIVMPPHSEWLFAVKFKGADKVDLVSRKEIKKYNIDKLLEFYESHLNILKNVKNPSKKPQEDDQAQNDD